MTPISAELLDEAIEAAEWASQEAADIAANVLTGEERKSYETLSDRFADIATRLTALRTDPSST